MLLNFFVDFIIVVILIGVSTIGYRRGLFLMLMKPFGKIGCFLVSFSLCPLLRDSVVGFYIEKELYKSFTTFLNDGMASEVVSSDELPEAVNVMLNLGKLNVGDISSGIGEGIEIFLLNTILPRVSYFLSTVISFILIFIIIKTIVLPFISSLSLTLNGGIVGKMNSILGFALTSVLGVICAEIFVITVKLSLEWGLLGASQGFHSFSGGTLYNMFLRLAYYFWS